MLFRKMVFAINVSILIFVRDLELNEQTTAAAASVNHTLHHDTTKQNKCITYRTLWQYTFTLDKASFKGFRSVITHFLGQRTRSVLINNLEFLVCSFKTSLHKWCEAGDNQTQQQAKWITETGSTFTIHPKKELPCKQRYNLELSERKLLHCESHV